MSDILNFNVQDDIFKHAFSNNPFYVQIKGEVNLCVAKCGQDIETCNDVEFSTMTNYGKILILNPYNDNSIKCKIKLAFDTSNDNADSNGGASYNFEKAFFTVPALHKIGEKESPLCDLETFLLFSSLQKNGTKIYVCLCTLSNGTDYVAQDDWKLLNFKLMDELFKKQIINKDKPLEKISIVPDIYGTNEIKGSPNPIDLSNFIPALGFRNFYDYTHPKNSLVNFRVFQTPLSVSNSVLEILRNKLTPGNIMVNFKTAINNIINPVEGLYFYFNEDLTNKYKSFQKNEKTTTTNDSSKESNVAKETKETKEKLQNLGDTIISEQEEHEKSNEFQKINENDKLEDENTDFDEKKNTEKFNSKDNIILPGKNALIYSILFISCYIITSWLLYSVVKFILAGNMPFSNSSLNDFVKNEAIGAEFNDLIIPRLKYLILWIFQIIISIITISLMVSQIMTSKENGLPFYRKIRPYIFIFLFMIFFIGLYTMYLIPKYLYFGLKLKNIQDFNSSEKYFLNNIMKIFSTSYSRNFWNLFRHGKVIDYNLNLENESSNTFADKLSDEVGMIPGKVSKFKSDVKSIVKSMTGGNPKVIPRFVPGPNLNNDSSKSKSKTIFDELGSNNSYGGFMNDILFGNKMTINISFQLSIILFFLFGGILALGISSLYYLNNTNINDCGLSYFMSMNNAVFFFIPPSISFIFYFARFYQNMFWDNFTNVLRLIILILWILIIFIPVLKCYADEKYAGAFAGIIILIIFIIGIIAFMLKRISTGNLKFAFHSPTNDKPIDYNNIKEMQNLLASKLINRENLRTKTLIIEDYLSKNEYMNDENALQELELLKEELNKDNIIINEIEKQIQIITNNTLLDLGINPKNIKGRNGSGSNNDNNLTEEISKLEQQKSALAEEILKLKNSLSNKNDLFEIASNP